MGEKISCCELATCFDSRLASQRICKPDCVGFFFSFLVDKSLLKRKLFIQKINNEQLVSETVNCLGLQQKYFLFPDTAKKILSKEDMLGPPRFLLKI